MRLVILGAGTLVPHAERSPAGLLVEAGGERILIDGGSGTLGRMARAGIDWRGVNHVFYTHFHPDHTLDLVSLLFAANYAPGMERTEPLYLNGPVGLVDFYQRVKDAWPSVAPKNYPLELLELGHGDTVRGRDGWEAACAAVAHGDKPALGYRIGHGDAVLACSGDTEYCESLVELCRGANLVVCECSAPDEHAVSGHMSPSQVARLARESGAGRIVITHVYAPADPAELAAEIMRNCDATVSGAVDLDTMEV